MKTNWKYTDATNAVVVRTLEDGRMESCLVSVLADGTEILPADPPSTEELNAPTLAKLDALDRKSIRALREGDSKRIGDIEMQAAELRGKLIK